MNNALLFIIPALIWGSTWFVIKFQLGSVPPVWSVIYRFGLAGIILLVYCLIRGIPLRFSLKAHLRIAMQASFLFGFNYWLVYLAEEELTSALMSVSFSTIIFMNILFGRLFLGRRTDKKVYFGAVLGVLGTFLIYFQDLKNTPIDELPVVHIILGFVSVMVASLGNVTSAANQSLKIPVVPSNGFGMVYGSLIMGLVALATGAVPSIELTPAYLGSLAYLSVFGSIIAFSTYLTLIGRIGADRAAYVLIVIPIISLIISTLFENYQFELYALSGLVLILGGNLLVMRK